MKRSARLSSYVVNSICFLYILLFVYAAVTKLIDFQQFKVQLGQSPLLVSFGHMVAFSVPILELIIAFLLTTKNTRLTGLYASFILMTMFTTYIVFILTFSPFVPCSCGGILEKMGWTEHLIFNIIFMILAGVGIILESRRDNGKTDSYQSYPNRPWRFTGINVSLGLLIGVLSVVILYATSTEMTQHRNSFDRLLPPDPVTKIAEMDIGFNSFYIAGHHKDIVYLGNITAPLYVKMINLEQWNSSHVQLEVERDSGFQFRANTRLQILPPYFYLTDGVTPRIWKGKLGQWEGKAYLSDSIYFNKFVPLSDSTFAIRAVARASGQNELGLLSHQNPPLSLSYGLLEKQRDGVFCTDGVLQYNTQLNQVLYTYHYRNQYLLMDKKLKLLTKGRTIDTNSIAKISVDTLGNHRSTMGSPPLMVNKRSCSSGTLLLVNSALMARNEVPSDFNSSDVIDVYDLKEQSYKFSFYIARKENHPIRDMQIIQDDLVTLQGNYIIQYRLEEIVFNRFFAN